MTLQERDMQIEVLERMLFNKTEEERGQIAKKINDLLDNYINMD